MPTPPPDPNGRSSSAQRAAGPGEPLPTGAGEEQPAADSKRSADPHHPIPESLSDVLRKSGSVRRAAAGSDVLRVLGNGPTPDAPADNIDDAPTVITRPGAQPPPPPTPLPVVGDPPSVAGRRLGHYELIEAIGAGGMAAVLKARDLELGRVVALKILPPESARDPESVARFKQEARAAALLDHENIARVYACGEDQGLHFIAFEFVEGINLRQMIDRRGTIPPGECVRYMLQVAAGLAHAAQRGLVHRDIKPSNIIITPDQRAKIVDMGLARRLDATPANGGVTQSGVTLGTFDYISPEQALDPRRADVRSDIYSLGCAFYHALTGRPPVPEGTAAKKLHAHQHTDPLDPRQLNPNIPDELVVILARMMAKAPAQRYQTPEELIAHLKGLAERLRLTDVIGQDSTVAGVPAEHAALPRPPRLRLGWALGGAAVAVAVAAFATSGGGTPRTAPPPWAADQSKAKVDPFAALGPNGTPNPAPVSDDGVVRTAEQFAAKFAEPVPDGSTKVQLAAGALIDLTTLADPVVFRGKQLELVGSANAPATVRVNAGPADAAESPRAGTLTVRRADAVTVSGIRFEVVSATVDPKSPEAGLTVVDSGLVRLADCVFAVTAARSVGAFRVVRSAAEVPVARVRAERCLFARGGFAVWLPDQADFTATDSGFGPHDAALRVGDPADIPGARSVAVTLDRSSFLLEPASAVIEEPLREGGTEPTVRVTAGFCVFAPVGGPPSVPPLPAAPTTRRPVLVRAKGTPGEVRFSEVPGRKNAYYRVTALGVVGEGGTAYFTFAQCQAEGYPVSDAGAVQLAQRPWHEREPLAVLDGKEPWRAFRLQLTDPAVFTTDERVKVIGAQFYNPDPGVLTRWRAYPDLPGQFPPPPKTSPSDPRQFVWWPDAPDPLPKDTFNDLRVLLRNVRPGDVVLIRHNGVYHLDETVELKTRAGASGEFRVTFRPDEDFHPVLAPRGGDAVDQCLFKLMSGEVAFEKVQFLLKPSRPRSDQQVVAAVTVVSGKGCSFTDCVFTLGEEDAKAAAVHVPNPSTSMVMDKGAVRPTPEVTFKNCVIRGRGRGVWVQAGLPVQAKFEQSLAAIDGPLFLAESGGEPGAARSSLTLKRATVFVGGPVVELRGSKSAGAAGSGLVPLDVHADESLFVAVPNAGRALVELDAIDPADAKNLLTWEVQHANRYADFGNSPAMVVRPADNSTPKETTWDQWIAFAREPGGKPVGKVTFENGPTGLDKLASLKPADAAVKMVDFPDLTGAKPGDAGTTERLPVPANE